ncbi:twin-arginine translocase subunit TatC [Halalkalicoccus jeotgali]|uniref:Sec-independent protein translocase protein TatC n=1 Tax=Halalkalicoccus jeotgali (strain DSM 18796 / CECT 7217 / JCM 14584 / KCTC 4019 / B3) TaxID=795797 RepID=D8J5Y5_HALJB|nr:twin-arginine translocase subunit TatC [Halalkalicoccus jeotgali]ADJ13791.1 Sec-independent periplasmic protein translocase [Halalkalicoccus jeotgali B3]ELY34163.1 Sec-independent periplasmic protein translocase [Halalkalicoccus jeotgali B3]
MSGSIVDEDTARSLNSGRETIGAVLSTIQTHLQKVFIVFVVGFLGTFYALRAVVWDWLRSVTVSGMPPEVIDRFAIIVTTPFEVILLQAKIGIVAGILVSIPPLLYLSRHELRARGYWPQTPIARWKLVGIALMSLLLFLGGVSYAYGLFFPLILGFLAEFSYGVGVDPTWSIVMWTEFLVLLTVSFGLAAQLPLAMCSLAYAEIVPYETFRDKWKYAVLGIFIFGAMFSPPDPISQIMWAVPLVILYAFSLGLTRFVVTLKRGGRANVRGTLKRNLPLLFGAPLLLAAGAYGALVAGLGEYFNELLLEPRDIALPQALWLQELLGVPREVALAVGAAAVLFAVAFVLVVFYLLISSVEQSPPGPTGRMGDPEAIDLSELDAAGVRAAPGGAFAALSEEEALAIAREAMDEENPEKAQAVLDRFDAIHAEEAEPATAADSEDAAAESAGEDDEEDVGGILTGTATGMFAAFSEEKDEDDIGGYLYDVKYIADSLRSRLLWIFAVFGVVLIGVFTFFYIGGVRIITQDFVSRMPRAVVSIDDVRVVDLHPVETLMFIIKVSTLVALLSIVPMVLYFAWPAMKERGLTRGQRSVVYEWTVAIALALAGGTLLGYYYIAPGLIGFLVYDATQAGMVISYRISKFSWLIIYTTVGVGLLACVPLTMWMLFRGKVASYWGMRTRWREVTIAVFAVAGLVTPVSVLTMFIVAIPTMLAYGVGLAGLWAITLGGRRDFTERPETGPDAGNSKWLALIIVVFLVIGGAVAATGGGIGSVLSDDIPDAPGPTEGDDPATGSDDNGTDTDSPAEDPEATSGDGSAAEPDDDGSSGSGDSAGDGSADTDSGPFEGDDESGDSSDSAGSDTDASEDSDGNGGTDGSDDDGENGSSGIDVREPIDG